MKHQYESEILYHLMERDGFNIPSYVPPYEAEIKAYLINQVKQAYPKLTDYEAEWLLYNYTKHLPADFPISSVSDVTTATFENVVPFAYQSAILKGQTLVNLKDYRLTNDNIIMFQSAYNDRKPTRVVFVSEQNLIKPSTTYLLKFTITDYMNNYGTSSISLTTHDYDIDATTSQKLSVDITKDGNYYLIVTTKSTLNFGGIIAIKGNGTLFENNTTSDVHIGISKIVLLEYQEGMENWDIPYFEGMQSVQMPVLTTTGKNLLKQNLWESGTINANTGDFENSTIQSRYNEFIPINVGDTFTFSSSSVSYRKYFLYDENKKFLETFPSVSSKKLTISIENTQAKYMRIWIQQSFDSLDRDIQLEKGSTATPYEPFKSNILTVNEDVTLRSNGNVYDELDLLTGKLTQRIDEDGSVLTQEVVKTVDLTTVNENGEKVYFMPLEGTMHVSCTSETIQPTFDVSVPVEATTQNLASFIDLEVEGE